MSVDALQKGVQIEKLIQLVLMNYFLGIVVLYLLTLVFRADCISWKRVLFTTFLVQMIQGVFFIANTQLVQMPYTFYFMLLHTGLDEQFIAAGLTIAALICQFVILKLSIQLSIRRTLVTVLLLFIVSHVPTWTASRSLLRLMTVSSGDMAPTLNPGDCILILLNRSEQYQPERNDLIAYTAQFSQQRQVPWQISRLVGLPGDRLSIADGVIFINGQRVGLSHPGIKTTQGREYAIPEGVCYCLGDNSAAAVDSRQLGLLPLNQISGHVELVVFPAFPRLLAVTTFLRRPATLSTGS